MPAILMFLSFHQLLQLGDLFIEAADVLFDDVC